MCVLPPLCYLLLLWLSRDVRGAPSASAGMAHVSSRRASSPSRPRAVVPHGSSTSSEKGKTRTEGGIGRDQPTVPKRRSNAFNDSKSPPPLCQAQFWGYSLVRLNCISFGSTCGSPPSAPPVPFPGAWPRSPFPSPSVAALSFPRTRTRRFQSAPLLSS